MPPVSKVQAPTMTPGSISGTPEAPADPACRSTLGVAYARLGRWTKALEELREATRDYRRRSAPLDRFFQAICLQKLGHGKDARTIFEQAFRARPLEERNDPNRFFELDTIQTEANRAEPSEERRDPDQIAELNMIEADANRIIGGELLATRPPGGKAINWRSPCIWRSAGGKMRASTSAE